MNETAGIALALTSALVWGAADFAGGLATRRAHHFQVLAVNAVGGILLLSLFAIVAREPLPSAIDGLWAASAGVAGAIGIAALYRGLATGNAAVVAPTSGVLTAAIPVLVSALINEAPQAMQLTGFLLAAVGIWLVAAGPGGVGAHTAGLRAAVLAGCGFGAFLILIAQVPKAQIFGPLAIARSTTLIVAMALLASQQARVLPRAVVAIALLAGVLDAGGNVLYLLARQHVRLDVAAVLSSFYPVATVALSRLVLKEPVSPLQWVGATVCLAAVALITR